MAAHTGISKSTVQRYLALFGVQPHRTKSFKLSTDPFFVEKVRDIVGGPGWRAAPAITFTSLRRLAKATNGTRH